MEWLTPAIEEYKTLRTESLESMKGQQSTLRAGTATVGVVIATGFNLWDKPILPGLIFLLFIPFICYLALVIWIGEVARMMRAGYYLTKIEQKINSIYPEVENVLLWENWLRTKDAKSRTPQMKLNYLAIIALFFATALASIIIGNFKIWDPNLLCWLWSINIFELIVFLISLFYIYKTGKRFEKL
jgi:hypothetical protein